MATEEASQVINVSCGAEKLLPTLMSSATMMVELVESTKVMEQKMVEMYDYLSTMSEIITHIHDAHLHWKQHTGEDKYDVGIGSIITAPLIGPVDRLLSEYNNSTDMDGNGLIFGKDFIIDEKDENYNDNLKNVTNLIPRNKLKLLKKISWSTYLMSVPDQGNME